MYILLYYNIYLLLQQIQIETNSRVTLESILSNTTTTAVIVPSSIVSLSIYNCEFSIDISSNSPAVQITSVSSINVGNSKFYAASISYI